MPIGGPSAWGLGKNDSKVAFYAPETASGSIILNTIAELTAHLKSSKCSMCKVPFFESELDVRHMLQDWADGVVDKLSSCIKCTSCSTTTCIACTPEPFGKPSKVGFQGKQHVSWCCVGGRTFLIWLLLCGFDRRFCETRSPKGVAKVPEPSQPEQSRGRGKNKKTKKEPTRGGGIGFGGSNRMSQMPNGLGYGSETHSAQQTEDTFGRLILEFLKDLLPSLDRETCFDYDPPAVISSMLSDSKILNYCAELLRNDSLSDAVKRKDLYQALFGFLSTIGGHYSTSHALFAARSVRPDTVNLLTLSFCGAVPGVQKESASALAECLRNFTTQSALVLQSAKSNEQGFCTDEDSQTMLWLCRQIMDLAQYIKANTEVEPSAKINATTEVLAVSEVADKLMLATHKYAPDAQALRVSQPGRFRRLITEITTLQTGLPPGIFVRYCEDRPDVLKSVIIGPVDTPYESGIFEFDIFCPAIFPDGPPQVNFKGTGGGRISINPNLYADGKVCLSLLGTWQGEPWKPGESTLLQVLISLQAMILCEEPWYNEPGREAGYHQGTGPSVAYNQTIREHTVRYAMLGWLDKPSPLWQDVVDQHFKQNGDAILKTVEDWAKAKNSTQSGPRDAYQAAFSNYDGMFLGASRGLPLAQGDTGSMLPQLQAALQKYGTTHVVRYVAPPVVRQPLAPRRPPPSSFLASQLQSSGVPSDLQLGTPDGLPPPPPPPGFLFSRGGFFGQGQLLGNGRGAYTGGLAADNIRGGSTAGGSPDTPGRYETRSSTRGRGGSAGGSGGGPDPTDATSSAPSLFEGDFLRREPLQRGRGRGGRGARGGRGNGSQNGQAPL
ncbi:hypothetical protein EJ02DRAFT_403007 [Clathrospora elynae]|uniref:UBC core domain-containing protein n=1 Tax=Clathrospora elynae TaxID=706981 RepID=A0A6A5SNC5_9PLEO|nr:hypothetical protein EJ02DRAFT_403007 [Clathrospora elynae]